MGNEIIIGLPISPQRQILMDTAAWVMQQAMNLGCRPVWAYAPAPEMGRNAIVEGQLRNPDVGHILFLDYDVVPPDDAVVQLMAMNQPIAAACVPIRVHGQPSWNVAKDIQAGYMQQIPRGVFEVQACGFGCVLVARPVFEAVGWPWFETTYRPMGDQQKCIQLGEDEFFCSRALGTGFKIWANGRVRCKHFNQLDLSEVCHELD
jgi:hypothetical protein